MNRKPSPDCREYSRDLESYADNELSDARNRAIESHLAACESCCAKLREIERSCAIVKGALGSFPRIAPRADFDLRVLARLESRQQSRLMLFCDRLDAVFSRPLPKILGSSFLGIGFGLVLVAALLPVCQGAVMERRFFGFAACILAWLVVLIVPETRHVFGQQIRGFAGFESADPTRSMPLAGIANRFVPKPPTFAQLATRYPNHIGVQLKAAEEKLPKAEMRETSAAGTTVYTGVATQAAYDETIKRFPNETWLLANRLRVTSGSSRLSHRTAGELDAGRQTLPNGQTRFIFRKPEPRTSTRADIDAAIAVARRGQEMEPDNSYFDAMLACFLFADYRDEEALRVLAAMKNKPRYDEHILEDNAARIAAGQLQSPMSFEAKLGHTASVLFPHYAAFRQMARLVVWKGIERGRAGNHAGALQLYDDASTLGARLRDGSTIYIGILVGNAIQQIAWNRDHIWTPEEIKRAQRPQLLKSPLSDVDNLQDRARINAERFATYARAHNRPDLAQQALRDNRINEALKARFSPTIFSSPFGLSEQIIRQTSLLLSVTALLLSQLQWMLLACGATTFLLWLARRVRRDTATTSAIRSIDVAGATACIACLIAVVLIAVASVYTPPFSSSSTGQNLLDFLWTPLVVSPLILGALYCLAATAWRDFKAARARRASTRAEETQEPGIAVETPSAKASFWQRDIGKLLVFTLNIALPATVVMAWLASSAVGADAPMDDAGNTQSTFLSGDYTFAVIVSLLAVFWWMVQPDKNAAKPSSRESMVYAVRWYRKTLLALTVLGSVAYAILALGSLPVRAQATKLTDDSIRQGEVAMLRRITAPASTRK